MNADTLLNWLARISLILAAWAFLAFLTAAGWHCARQAVRRRAAQRNAQRAWGPDADQPVPYTVELDKADEALWEAELAEGSDR